MLHMYSNNPESETCKYSSLSHTFHFPPKTHTHKIMNLFFTYNSHNSLCTRKTRLLFTFYIKTGVFQSGISFLTDQTNCFVFLLHSQLSMTTTLLIILRLFDTIILNCWYNIILDSRNYLIKKILMQKKQALLLFYSFQGSKTFRCRRNKYNSCRVYQQSLNACWNDA